VVTVVLKVFVVLLAPLAPKASRERRVPKDALVLVGSRVSKGQRVTLATVVPKVPVVVVQQVPKVLRESKVPRVTLARLVLKVSVAATV